jgi:hypothetical protein
MVVGFKGALMAVWRLKRSRESMTDAGEKRVFPLFFGRAHRC